MAKGDYKRLTKACQELKIKVVGEKTEDLIKDFLGSCDERLKGIPEGEEKNHFSEETMKLYNELVEREKSTKAPETQGSEKVVEDSELKKIKEDSKKGTNRYSRIDSVTDTLKSVDRMRNISEITNDADILYVEKKGKSNNKESKYYTKIILQVLGKMGLLKEADGKFYYNV